MPSRVIREGILTSTAVNQLSPAAEVFYRRLHSVADDFGLFTADLRLLRANLYPLRLDAVSEADIKGWLDECRRARNGSKTDRPLVETYEVNGKTYLIINKFHQRLRQHRTKFPWPPKRDLKAEHRQRENQCL